MVLLIKKKKKEKKRVGFLLETIEAFSTWEHLGSLILLKVG